MKSLTIVNDTTHQKVFPYLLISDLHIGSKGVNKTLIEKELSSMKDRGGQIFVNGDVGEFILPKDFKRYNASGDKYGVDTQINATIDEVTEFLKPYSKHIKLIGLGNHETAMIRHNGFDPVKQVIYNLNREGGDIAHGHYTGFIRLKYHKPSLNKERHGSVSETIFYHHGAGGKAEISKGTISLNRFMTSREADVYWMGHTHTKVVLPDERVLGLDKKGNIKESSRTGVITGSYKRNAKEYDAIKEEYSLSYGEESFRTSQSTGGIVMRHEYISGEVYRKWEI